MNSDDGYDYIQEQVYRNQYLSIKNDLQTAKKKSFIFHANNLLDFCEGSINKSKDGINWTNPQRIILNHAIKEKGYPEYYIDWDICYQLFSMLNPEINNDIGDLLEDAIHGLLDGLDSIISLSMGGSVIPAFQKVEGEYVVTIEDLINRSSKNNTSAELILKLYDRIKDAPILLKDTLGIDSQGTSDTSKRTRFSNFNSLNHNQKLNDIISDKLIEYVMERVASITKSADREWRLSKTDVYGPSNHQRPTIRSTSIGYYYKLSR